MDLWLICQGADPKSIPIKYINRLLNLQAAGVIGFVADRIPYFQLTRAMGAKANFNELYPGLAEIAGMRPEDQIVWEPD